MREALERRGVELRQALALLEEPFVVAALEQIAGVRVDGLLQAAVRDRLLEDRDIEPERGVLAPLQRARAHVDQAVGIRERPAQVVQDLTQIRPRLGLGRLRPEQERKTLTWLRRIAMHQQVRQQRLGARRVEGRHPRLAQPHVETAEQTDAQRRPPRVRAAGLAGWSVHCVRTLRSAPADRSAVRAQYPARRSSTVWAARSSRSR